MGSALTDRSRRTVRDLCLLWAMLVALAVALGACDLLSAEVPAGETDERRCVVESRYGEPHCYCYRVVDGRFVEMPPPRECELRDDLTF